MERRFQSMKILEELSRGSTLAFLVLIILASITLVLNQRKEANKLAEAAYYTLVASVSLALASIALDESNNKQHTWGRAPGPEGKNVVRVLNMVKEIMTFFANIFVRQLAILKSKLGITARVQFNMRKVLTCIANGSSVLLLAPIVLLSGLAVIPGRPTIIIPSDFVSDMFIATLALLALIGGFSLTLIDASTEGIAAIILGAVTLTARSLLVPIAVGILITITTIYRKLLQIECLAFTVLTSLVILLDRVTAWIYLTWLTLVAIVVGFSVAVTIVYETVARSLKPRHEK